MQTPAQGGPPMPGETAVERGGTRRISEAWRMLRRRPAVRLACRFGPNVLSVNGQPRARPRGVPNRPAFLLAFARTHGSVISFSNRGSGKSRVFERTDGRNEGLAGRDERLCRPPIAHPSLGT